MYSVNGEIFNSYMTAIKKAQELQCDVIQVDNGLSRWTPPAPVSKKQTRRYNERKAAYEAAKKHGLA